MSNLLTYDAFCITHDLNPKTNKAWYEYGFYLEAFRKVRVLSYENY